MCRQALLVSLPLLMRTPVTLDQSPTLRPHLTLITFLKALSPNTGPLVVRATNNEFCGDESQPTSPPLTKLVSGGARSAPGFLPLPMILPTAVHGASTTTSSCVPRTWSCDITYYTKLRA